MASTLHFRQRGSDNPPTFHAATMTPKWMHKTLGKIEPGSTKPYPKSRKPVARQRLMESTPTLQSLKEEEGSDGGNAMGDEDTQTSDSDETIDLSYPSEVARFLGLESAWRNVGTVTPTCGEPKPSVIQGSSSRASSPKPRMSLQPQKHVSAQGQGNPERVNEMIKGEPALCRSSSSSPSSHDYDCEFEDDSNHSSTDLVDDDEQSQTSTSDSSEDLEGGKSRKWKKLVTPARKRKSEVKSRSSSSSRGKKRSSRQVPKQSSSEKAKVSDAEDTDEEYEVECILDINHSGECLIKWKGYDEVHNSWEPKANLNCDALIKEFEAKQKAIRKKPRRINKRLLRDVFFSI